MADAKVSAFTAASALDGTELLAGVQGGNSRKITVAQVKTQVSSSPTLVTPVLGVATATSVTFTAAATGVVLKQGANGLVGTFVANGTTPVTVSNTNVAISDAIIISLNTVGGTVGVQPHVATITAATGFTVVCTASDTSTYNYAILKNAA